MAENKTTKPAPAEPREVKVDTYEERPYSEAMTDEQRDALKDADLL